VQSVAKGCQTREVTFVSVIEPVPVPPGGPYVTDAEEKPTPAMTVPREREQDRFAGSKQAAREAAERSASEDIMRRTEDYLRRICHDLEEACPGIDFSRKVIASGRVAEAISEFATKSGADLIMVATHGRGGVSRWAYGSVADRILRSACVPVLMVRPPECIPSF
jgi:nucleotide-binding universal stress UspA family protein